MAIKSKNLKFTARERTKLRIRKRVFGSDERPRLSVFRSSKHTYAQLILDEQGATVVSASTRDAEVKKALEGIEIGEQMSKSSKSLAAARAVGIVLAQKAKEKFSSIVFDRNGYKYCGRVQAVADGAREGGLEF